LLKIIIAPLPMYRLDAGAMKNSNDQNRSCHPERSEGSVSMGTEILRFAQDDKPLPILFVKNHYRPMARRCAPQADKSAMGAK
jgi:hypothetical protein